MDSYTSRIVIFAVSLMVIMITFSLAMSYFNVSKDIATQAGLREDIVANLEEILNDKYDDGWIVMSGVELRSLIRKYAGDETVKIVLAEYNDGDIWKNANLELYEKDGNETKIVDETVLSLINPVLDYKIEIITQKNGNTLFWVWEIVR